MGQEKMITFKQYTDIISKISKKLDVTKDIAIAALVKAQQKGIDPIKWQKYMTMLNTFVKIMIKAEHEPDIEKEVEEAKQGYALVVGGKIAARGSKRVLMKKVKKDKIKLDPKGDQNFLTYTGKEVGDSW